VAVLQVHQTEDGEGLRNDRLLLRPVELPSGEEALLKAPLRKELEQFFQAAVLGRGKVLQYKGWASRRIAVGEIRRAASLYKQKFVK